MGEKDQKQGDELLKRLWDMPPKPHDKIKGKKKKAKKKAQRKKKPAK